jgi:hypothetical protein
MPGVIDPPIWERVSADWPALLDGARERVHTERWAPQGATLERPEPLASEREGNLSITATTPDPPTDFSGAVRYGFAEDGTLVLAERFGPSTISAWVEVDGLRVLIKCAPGGPDWNPNLMELVLPRYAGDRLTGLDARWIGAETIDIEERYGYDADGRLTTIAVREHRDDGVHEIDYEATYDPDGELAMLRSRARIPEEGEQSSVDYQRRGAASVDAAQLYIEHSLPERVAAWARRVAPREPVAALALIYIREDGLLPPALAIVTEADRLRLAATAREPGVPAEVWNAGDWTLFDGEPDELMADTRLLAAFEVVRSQAEEIGSDERVRRVLVKCAKAVANELPDLVVLAVDDELEDLERNLRATTTAAERRRMETA